MRSLSKLDPTFGLTKHGLTFVNSYFSGAISVVTNSAPLATSCMTILCAE